MGAMSAMNQSAIAANGSWVWMPSVPNPQGPSSVSSNASVVSDTQENTYPVTMDIPKPPMVNVSVGGANQAWHSSLRQAQQYVMDPKDFKTTYSESGNYVASSDGGGVVYTMVPTKYHYSLTQSGRQVPTNALDAQA
jgi:hypothetical protein